MPFLSIEFAILFMAFLPIYWLFGQYPKKQNLLLLIAGLIWLGYAHIAFVGTVVIFTSVIAFIARRIEIVHGQAKKNWLILGISLALLQLITFKYYDFFRSTFGLYDTLTNIIIPLGISYYTFQAIAYLVAIYRQERVHLKWHELLLHFSFLPTINSGPIFRSGSMKSINGIEIGASEQIQTTKPRQIIKPALAITLILIGITKKWWLSGSLADYWINPIFENPMQYDSWTVLAGIYGYTVQLFWDFSGYTDLVIGMAMLLGFQLPENFKMPLLAHNIRDFWNRWHISLSTWIRDYIYIPLGGNRVGFIRIQLNLMLAMILSGVWHGYGWNFFLWGCLHGIALVLLNIGDHWIGKREALAQTSIGKILGILTTLHFVCFAFVIFHTNSLSEARLMFQALFTNPQGWGTPSFSTVSILLLFSLLLIGYKKIATVRIVFSQFFEKLPWWLWPIPITFIMIILMIFAPSGIPGFIYANF